jgi:hypothetical protein
VNRTCFNNWGNLTAKVPEVVFSRIDRVRLDRPHHNGCASNLTPESALGVLNPLLAAELEDVAVGVKDLRVARVAELGRSCFVS